MEKRKFYIYQEDLIRYVIKEDYTIISRLVQDLNNKYCEEGMKRLRTQSITDYLVVKGYLVVGESGKKIPTKKGELLGIKQEYIIDEKGEKHKVNLYNRRAQEYILDNLYKII
ncbi:hypothetical protein AAA173_26945 [Enterocloster aldenensis]|mgnify:FL=1|uniref:hypothetical protein n=1 Tax=Enterocloster aldenensis TaxID=358742 RepID=UPI000ED58316|nr:hypothetical protein DW690_27510 [Dorea longicatena]